MARSAIHRDLRTPKYRQRVVGNKKKQDEDEDLKRNFLRFFPGPPTSKYSSGGVEKVERYKPKPVSLPKLKFLEPDDE